MRMSSAHVERSALETAQGRRWWVLAVLCISVLLVSIDNTIVNIALPTLSRELDASTADLQWIVDAYVVCFAGLLLVCGSVGDRVGRKRVLQFGLVVFLLASVGAALSSSTEQLVAARAVMGVGVAFVFPATLALVSAIFRTPLERGVAVGVWAGVSGMAIGLGPVVGGLLLEHFEWNSIFLVNVPVGLLALVLGARLLPESRDPAPGRFDALGGVLSVALVGLLVWTVIEAPSRGWTDPVTLAGFAVSLLLLAAFLALESRRRDPLLDLSLFRDPRFAAASMAIAVAFFALFGFIFMITQYFQLVREYSVLEAGLATMPFAIVMGVLSPLSMLIVRWVGTKPLMVLGMLLMAAGFAVVAQAPMDAGYWSVIVVSMCLIAAGMALATSPATEAILASLPEAKAGVGSAVNDTTREFGGALGVAVIGSTMSWYYGVHLATSWSDLQIADRFVRTGQESLAEALTLSQEALPLQIPVLVEAAQESFMHGVHAGSAAAAVAALVGALVVLVLMPSRKRMEVPVREAEPVREPA